MSAADAQSRPTPAVLVIIDGFGVAPSDPGNAVSEAQTPVLDRLVRTYPAMTLRASGEAVGLDWGEMGNSEVGHLAIGAGRVYYQSLPRINKAIEAGVFFENPALVGACAQVKKTGGTLHIMGLMSAGKVHAVNTHAYALLDLAKREGVSNVAVHAFLDGRDTLYNAGHGFIAELLEQMHTVGVGRLATLCGRFYAMDRDRKWDRIEQAYQAIVRGIGPQTEDPLASIVASYAKEVYDEQFLPTVVTHNGVPVATVQSGDVVIFFNYRPDRARLLTQALVLPTFEGFARDYITDLHMVTMMEYEAGLPVQVAFPPEVVSKGLCEVLSNTGFTQLKVAETEKYAHVTFFINGTREEPFPGEDRIMIPSPQVASYDEVPAMSTESVTEAILQDVKTGGHDVIIANMANPDMVAHTGNVAATKEAVEVVDTCLGRIVDATLARGGVVFITADHGNAEEVANLHTGDIDKEHSTNPVPFLIVSEAYEGQGSLVGDAPGHDLSLIAPVGMLVDVAPTILSVLGIPKPKDMTGQSLLA